MATYITMQNRLADEVRQTSTAASTDISTNITRAIQSAIAFHEREAFFFNEAFQSITTVSGQEYYSTSDAEAIATMVDIVALRIAITSTNVYDLVRVQFKTMDEMQVNPSATGQPTHYSYWAQQIRLYPIPDSSSYTLKMAYIKRFTALSADSDTNAWTTEAEELIRSRAAWDLYTNVLKSPDEAAAAKAQELAALQNLRGETNAKAHTGRVRPTQF